MECLMCKYDEEEATSETDYYPIGGLENRALCDGCVTILANWKIEMEGTLLLVDETLPEETKDKIREDWKETVPEGGWNGEVHYNAKHPGGE